MVDFFFNVLQIFLLVLALSIDSFIACFGYGSSNIKIPFKSTLIISSICSLSLGVSLYLGGFLAKILSVNLNIFSFIIIFIMGIIKLFDSIIKIIIKRHKNFNKNLSFNLFNLKFILCVYADPEHADIDQSKVLSCMEAASLAIALSIDSITVGIGAYMNIFYSIWAVAIAFLINIIAVKLAVHLGKKASAKLPFDFSFISGILLIGLAIVKLI